MSDDDDVDPFALPGMVTQRQHVTVSDVSSDDDEGTFAALKSGAARKDALKEKELLKAKKAQAAGQSGSEPAAAVVPDDDVAIIETAEPSPKRARKGGKAKASPVNVKGSTSPALDPRDEALVVEAAKTRAHQAKELQSLRNNFLLHEDDDDGVGPTRPQARSGGSSSRAAHGRAQGGGSTSGPTRKIMLHVYTDGTDEPAKLMLPRDEPISRGDFLHRVACALTLDECERGASKPARAAPRTGLQLMRAPPAHDHQVAAEAR